MLLIGVGPGDVAYAGYRFIADLVPVRYKCGTGVVPVWSCS